MNSQIDFQSSESVTVPQPGLSFMGAIWRTIRGYILWSHERGTLHYDIMVTLILLFVFLSPRYLINYNDKPVERNPHPTGVVVIPDAQGVLIYQIPATAITDGKNMDVRQQLQHIIEPISGAVSITKYEPVKDGSGRVQSYKVWVEKE